MPGSKSAQSPSGDKSSKKKTKHLSPSTDQTKKHSSAGGNDAKAKKDKDDRKKKLNKNKLDKTKNSESDKNGEDAPIASERDLLREIEALGGSKEDLDLIDIDSGSESEIEIEDGGKSIKDDEVSKYMKEIGFNVSDPENKKAKAKEVKETKEAKKEKKDKKKAEKSLPIEPVFIDTSSIVHPGTLIVEPLRQWYEVDLEQPQNAGPLAPSTIHQLHEKAKALLQKENEVYKDTRNAQKLAAFMSGTLNDKLSALTLAIAEAPLHSVKYFQDLLGLCKKKSRSSAIQAINSLKELFAENAILPNRKLKWFKNQPLSADVSKEWLTVWAFEDWLKGFYFELVQTLETLSHDTVPQIRRTITMDIFDLLKSKPEQEVNLLRLGVNKLGDKDRNVASSVVQLLLRLEEVHPAMKGIVVEAVSELIFRPGSDYHARYYGIITLNQTTILNRDVELANSLMKIYLTLYERLLAEWNLANPKTAEAEEKKVKKPRWKNKKGKKGGERVLAKASTAVKEEEDSKMTNAILTGLVRAFPFSELSKEVFDQHIDSLYRATHSPNFGTSLQALKLIHLVTKSQSILSDRFYRTLYESLLDPRLAVSNKHLKDYMNLLFRSMVEDGDNDRLKAFAKRIVQMATSWLSVGVVSAVLFLLQELSKAKSHLRALFDEEMKSSSEYDGRKRDPVHANAGNTKLWEIIPLLSHYHPTITFYAQGLLENDNKLQKPDLDLHTLNHFLDRFVYKNPKKKTVTRGSAIMQPLSGANSKDMVPVTSMEWSQKKLEDIDVSERFFFQYFMNRDKPIKPSNEGGELDEEDVWQALVDSRPEVEDDGADFDEEDLSDMSGMSDGEDEEDEVDEDAEEGEVEDIDLDDIEIEDISDEEIEDEEETEVKKPKKVSKDSDESDFGDFGDDESDIIDSDAEIDLGKRKAGGADDHSRKKRRLKDLPEFASAEDYAHLLGSDDEDYS